MRHVRERSDTKIHQRRQRIAIEAARLMAVHGIRDLQQAKLKAAQKLGILDQASLPPNTEVQEQLRQYQRLFQAQEQPQQLRVRREAALQAMDFFRHLHPRLVGSVLDGSADAHSAICLHLHADDADVVARMLMDHGIPADAQSRRLRLDRQRTGDFPVWQFLADGLPFDLTVLPMTALRQAPLGGADEEPMPRASMIMLKQLLADETIAPASD